MTLVAIDIGTTKICVLIAQENSNNSFDVIGIGRAPSKGLARGVVVDILAAAHSIKLALKEAELMAGCKVEAAVIGISGSHISSFNSQGMISLKHKSIREYDMQQVLAVAQAIPLAEGQQILHALPQFYTIDGNQRVINPLGMFGMRLEANVHIITGAIGSVQNLIRCCELAGVKVKDIVLEPLASAHAVLSVDEREMGVALLDIGGGTSDFAIYQNSSMRHTKVFPYAGDLFTNDIAVVLRTTRADAERLKKEYAAVYKKYIDPECSLDVECAQTERTMTVSQYHVYEILESRITELLLLIRQEIKNYTDSTLHKPHAGLVITGGGSLIKGIQEHAENIVGIPVRIGKPKSTCFKEFIENPMHATGYGLLVYSMQKNSDSVEIINHGSLSQKVLSRMKSWVFDFF